MEKIEYTEKTYSFYQLISDYRIEIPIIQRDYAQGREDKSEIRNNFLSALLQSMQPASPRLKLDFIYGSVISGCFQPLDGQQRLSTLFLLHWFAALKVGMLNSDTKKLLSKFTYETRISSRDFCSALINNDLNINNYQFISEAIIDSPWFFLSWKKDPTISAMLRTIDDINDKFAEIRNLWDKLISENCPIYFYFVQLENIGLTDDLYIKMNARGKLLSHFENFKASLQKIAQDKSWDGDYELKDRFSFKIDTDWTDFFWSNFRIGDNIDESLMRFISTIVMIKLASDKTVDDRITWIKKLNDDHNNLRPTIITQDCYLYIYNCFELYNARFSDLKNTAINFPMWRHAPTHNFLVQIANPQNIASYSHKVLFFAQTEYLLRNPVIDIEKYGDWMRVVRNVVARANIDASGKRPDIIRSPETFDGSISLIAELSNGCSDIYTYLSEPDRKITSSFAKNQIEEEKLKARLISKDSEYKEIIWKLEDTDLLMGRIDFALHCLTNYEFGNIESIDKDNLKTIADVIVRYFNKDGEINPDFRRALLTIEHNGKYEYYNYWWSYWYVGEANKRCLIDKFREIEYCIAHEDCKEYLKKLILRLSKQSYSDIIDSFIAPDDMPNWKIRLIKEKQHLHSSFSNFIAIAEDDSFCYLLKSKRPREVSGNKQIK